MTWIDCVLDNEYEIFTEPPYQIRRKSNKRIIKESIHKSSGYIRCLLNQREIYKHVILANQFIPNPQNLKFVDHRNKVRTDNRLENLRWVTRSLNNRNRVSNGDYVYTYVDEISDNAIPIEEYSNHEFENYFYDPDSDKFYYQDDNQYKELRVCTHPTGLLVNLIDLNGKQVKLRLKKFKRLYCI